MAKRSKRRQTKKQKIISRLITITCLAVFLYASYGLISTYLDYHQNRKVLGQVQDLYYQTPDSDEDMTVQSRSDGTQIRSGFDALLAQNEHVVGWITIEGTKIDYPVLQTENNEDYMYTNFFGKDSRAGSIFLDYRNDITTENKNTILYGHRMKDGTMFQNLTKYLDREFFETHGTFTFDTLYDQYEAEVFAVYKTLVDFYYIETDFSNDAEFAALIDDIQARSLFESDVEVTSEDHIITLSTCDHATDPKNGRLVVHAKLTKKE